MTADLANVVASAAANGVQVTQPANPYTPVFYAICTGIIVQLGWIARSIITGIPARTKADSDAEIAKRKADAEAELEFRKGLMLEIGALRSRITDLEKAVVDERRSCVEQIQAIEKRHNEETASLRGEIKGLRDNMIQASKSTGTAIALGLNAPTAAEKFGGGQ